MKLPLQGRKNIGQATARDLQELGIATLEQLAAADGHEMYERICKLRGVRQDPCVLDTYLAIVHNARTGEERTWWSFTPERKLRFPKG